jgi:hypothetical protein
VTATLRPPAAGPTSRARRLALAAALVVVGTVAQLLRTPGISSWRSLLAEDGGIFYTDALNDPLITTLGRAYEGYLHVVPRTIAAVASLAPVPDAGLMINGGAALVVSVLALYLWSATAPVLPSPWGRGLLLATFLLLPAAGWEANASINNLHWYFNFACFWVFVRPLQTRGAVIAGCIVAGAAVLSDPLTALFVPLVAYRVLRAVRPPHEGPRGRVLAAPIVFFVCLALQALYGVSEKAPEAFVDRDWKDIPGTYGWRVAGSIFVGDRWTPGLFDRFGLVFALALLGVAIAAAAYALSVAGGLRPTVALCLTYSAVFLAVPLLIRGTSIYLDREVVTLNGSRYMLVPALLLLSGLLIAFFASADPASAPVGRPVPARGEDSVRLARVLLLALVGVVLVLSYRTDSIRAGGPDWREGVAAAQERCRVAGGDEPGSVGSAANSWATVVGPGQVAVPTAPGLPKVSSWNVVTDCKHILKGSN